MDKAECRNSVYGMLQQQLVTVFRLSNVLAMVIKFPQLTPITRNPIENF